MRKLLPILLLSSMLTGCNLAPDMKMPDWALPSSYKEQPAPAPAAAKEADEEKANWTIAQSLAREDRGQWWKIFGDEQLNALELQAADANQSLKAAAARVEEARAGAASVSFTLLPDIDLGANAVRTRQSPAGAAGFGSSVPASMKPFTRYSASGILSYELDLFGAVRNNYRAAVHDAEAEAATYRSVLLALQADVAQNYFYIRALDSERQLLRDTIKIRDEALRIMQRQYDVGEAGEQDLTRTLSEKASARAELLALDRQRAILEHALAVLLGKMPSDFALAEAPLVGSPPSIPAGLPSTLLERRPDISAAADRMAAANDRIGVARAAFFPSIGLTASGGFESLDLSDLFKWSNRTWALGQVAGSAVTMPLFNSGRLLDKLDATHAAYEESLANYKQTVLTAFRDVEDNLTGQRLLADQAVQLDAAAAAAGRTTEVVQLRYHTGDTNFFEVVNTQRDSLAAGRAAVQIRGQRFATTVNLIRALGGGWDEATMVAPPEPPKPATEEPAKKPEKKKGKGKKMSKAERRKAAAAAKEEQSAQPVAQQKPAPVEQRSVTPPAAEAADAALAQQKPAPVEQIAAPAAAPAREAPILSPLLDDAPRPDKK